MSLIEVLIASAILLVIAVGLLPLLTRSMLNNVQGWRSTTSTTFARSSLEELSRLDLMHDSLEVAGTESSQVMYYTDGAPDKLGDADEGWWTGAEISSKAGDTTWTRERKLRQYNLADLTTPIDGTTPSPFVHLKEAEVIFTGGDEQNAHGQGQTLRIRVLKAF